MFNYKAYRVGHKKSYKVTQIRWEGNEKFIAFDGSWHKESDCIISVGTGVFNSEKNEIFEGDILQLIIPDESCYFKNSIGIVKFREGEFYWCPLDSWISYSLRGKRWKSLGSVFNINDIKKNYNEAQINKHFKTIFNQYNDVLVEKYKPEIKKNTYINSIVYESEKQRKKLLHQYENYLKIKSLIESNQIDADILDLNLKEKK